MNIRFYLFAAALTASSALSAAEFSTSGEGVNYTFAILSEMPDTGVTATGDGEYTVDGSLTISENDSFTIAGTKTLKLADDASITMRGYADFDATSINGYRTLVTAANPDGTPLGIEMAYDSESDEVVTFKGVDFEYVQLRGMAIHGFEVIDCTFRYANGAMNGVGALSLGSSGASFLVKDCTFEANTVPAIGCPANFACPLTVDNCVFIDNNTSNTNKPQLNLTVAGDAELNISGCTVTGTGRNMVGGIAVGNLMAMSGTNQVNITGCTITDCRYGITGVGPMSMRIADNTLVDNNHEENPMMGGSAISLAGYNYGLDAIISGNHIENSLWGVTLIQCRNVSLGEVDNPDSPGRNVFVNNGNNGTPYDLYNNGIETVYAQNNTWGVAEQTEELIETVIYHKADDPSLGEVIFMPPYNPSSVETIEAHKEAPTAIFDLQGRPSTGTSRGIYIMRHGDSTSKVLR